MKRFLVRFPALTVMVVLLLFIAGGALAASMTDYCIIPPYVKRDIKPNVMILMDNSKAMGGPIYSWTTSSSTDTNISAFSGCTDPTDPLYSRKALTYDPATKYLGLFKSTSGGGSPFWYRYQGNQFVPDSSGVFEGNLLNFLTTSQYDLIEQVLVGGKSTSRQSNVNTLSGYNASYKTCADGTAIVPWDKRVFRYQGTDGTWYACEFTTNEGNRGELKISDSTYYYNSSNEVCGLIKTPAVRPAAGYYYEGADASDYGLPKYASGKNGESWASSLAKGVATLLNDLLEFFSSPAEAAALRVVSPGSNAVFTTTLYQAMTSSQCTAAGGDGIYSWSASGLPSGITLSAGGLFSGTPDNESDTTAGDISVTITLSDSSGATATRTVVFRVTGAPLSITAPTTTLTAANRGTAYNYQCMASGGSGSYSNWQATNLPTGLSIDASTGRISGTPTAAAGTYAGIVISVFDGHVTKTVTVTMALNETLTITAPTSSLSAFYNASYSYTCAASGGTSGYTWAASGLPAGLSINSSTGVISGTPTVMGTYSVTITVTSGALSTSATIPIVVTGVRITWPSSGFNMGDTIYNKDYTDRFRAVATGSSTGSYTWSASPWNSVSRTGLPPGLSMNAATGVISGKCTDSSLTGSSYSFTISVTDGVTSHSVTAAMFIWSSGSDITIILPTEGTVLNAVQGYQYAGYSAETFYGDGQPHWEVTGLPAGISYYPGSGLIYGTATGGVGCYAVVMKVWDNAYVKSSSRNVQFCVASPSAPTITAPATDFSYLPNAEINRPYSYVPAATGGTAPYTWSAAGLPAGFSVNTSTGTISGTTGIVATYTVTFTVTDSAGRSSNRTVYLDVLNSPSITAPASGDALPGATEGAAYAYSAATAIGGTGSYTWSVTGLPSGLSINSSTGVISGTPASGTAGMGASGRTYTLVITVTDSLGGSYSVSVTLTVTKSGFTPNTANFNVHVCAGTYDLNCNSAASSLDCSDDTDQDNCNNAGGYCDGSSCELKTGILQTYWEQARFGVMQFDATGDPNVDECVNATPNRTDFFTAIENAVPSNAVTKLVDGEHMAIRAYGNDLTGGEGTCDPFSGYLTDPNHRCRKNFVLILTNGEGAASGTDLFATSSPTPVYPTTACPTDNASGILYNLAQNACYGYNAGDLRPASDGNVPGVQKVSTYAVNAAGVNGEILNQATAYSDGQYYYSADANELRSNIEQALKDIITRAASGTAASVLASGEGSGANLVQAVFYPQRKFLDDDGLLKRVFWTGRLSNFWYYVDPFFEGSAIMEDTDANKVLDLASDNTISFEYLPDPDDKTVANILEPDGDTYQKDFEAVASLWEAGYALWKRDLSTNPRTIKTTTNGTSLINFSTGSAGALKSYLNSTTADNNESEAIIRWVNGEDDPEVSGVPFDYRNRKLKIDLNGDGDNDDQVDMNGDGDTSDTGEDESEQYVWKLGDILNSTPRIASHIKLAAYDVVNFDDTYSEYVSSSDYTGRGMVYAGGNDGMLHAFNLGKLTQLNQTYVKAQLDVKSGDTADDFGKEEWAYIPKNALPFLKYLKDNNYDTDCHLYLVDLTPFVFDASIESAQADYWNDVKSVSSWRTVLIGGMRFGGGCREPGTCSSTDDCVDTPKTGLGYSSYFALDVTDEDNPSLLWEFSTSSLGFATTGPAVVRINGDGGSTDNGRWFVIFGSGPTGPIDASVQQFLGRSNQNLKLFIFDVKKGPTAGNYWELDTNIQKAFAGSLMNVTHDYDVDYQDDVVYIPYVQDVGSAGTWAQGGVGRLVTNSDLDPANWKWTKVLEGLGPVTSSVAKLQSIETGNEKLWLFFGTGRYYYESYDVVDDGDTQRHLFGIQEQCFQSESQPFQSSCADGSDGLTITGLSDLVDKTTDSTNTAVPSSKKGWYIGLDATSSTYKAERVITDPLASSTGLVYFTSYKPYADECELGGKSYIWALKYNTGGAPGALLKGKAIVQVSTGSIEQIDLQSAFSDKGGRRSAELEGVPPIQQGLSILSSPPPKKRVIHMKER